MLGRLFLLSLVSGKHLVTNTPNLEQVYIVIQSLKGRMKTIDQHVAIFNYSTTTPTHISLFQHHQINRLSQRAV